MEPAQDQDKEQAFWQKLVLPEEDRQYPWDGKGYRWFRSANIIPIERYRRQRHNSNNPNNTDGCAA
jgi:hypothetical protein